MSEENTPETVAWEYQVINYRDITKNPVEAVGEDMHNSPHKLIRLSDHKKRMEAQREEVLEVIEDFSVFDLISDKLDAGGDPAFISWEKIDERVRQDLKQKLKSEVREDV